MTVLVDHLAVGYRVFVLPREVEHARRHALDEGSRLLDELGPRLGVVHRDRVGLDIATNVMDVLSGQPCDFVVNAQHL